MQCFNSSMLISIRTKNVWTASLLISIPWLFLCQFLASAALLIAIWKLHSDFACFDFFSTNLIAFLPNENTQALIHVWAHATTSSITNIQHFADSKKIICICKTLFIIWIFFRLSSAWWPGRYKPNLWSCDCWSWSTSRKIVRPQK